MAELIIPSLLETLYMVSVSTVFSLLIGFPLGILLVITEKDGIWEKQLLNNILNGVINILRSFPFLILMILLFPLSKIIVGKTIGTTVIIGVHADPHSKLVNLIKDDLEKDGVKLTLIEFTDYIKPNLALNEGEIDANFFQHLPYLENNLNPVKDGLIIEGTESPYANIVAVRSGEETQEKFIKLIKALQSDKVKQYIGDNYDGGVVPAF